VHADYSLFCRSRLKIGSASLIVGLARVMRDVGVAGELAPIRAGGRARAAVRVRRVREQIQVRRSGRRFQRAGDDSPFDHRSAEVPAGEITGRA
jgi:hypothetical protein